MYICRQVNICGVVNNKEGYQRIQQDVASWKYGLRNGKIKYNPDKCEMLQFSRSEVRGQFAINGRTIGSIDVQRDLMVQVQYSLKVATPMSRVIYFFVRQLIVWGSEYKSLDVMLQMYKTLVGLHLKNCVHFWLRTQRKDMEALERTQTRFTRILPGNRVY